MRWNRPKSWLNNKHIVTEKNNHKTVLVTGIGGNVGYGILMNIRQNHPAVRIIGTNTDRVSAGNHLCDEVIEVPFALNNEYLPVIRKIYREQQVDLVIPSTDYEAYVLAPEKGEMNIAVSSPEAASTFLDKYLTYQKLQASGLAFAESILPSDYKNQFSEYIVKPRDGRGSRGLLFNPPDVSGLADTNIVQPLLKGVEITTAAYITRQNTCHGLITMKRQLDHGATYKCQVVTEYDDMMAEYIQKLIGVISISGSFNIQSIVTDGVIVPFEINCRISGTNSIRTHFGFKDVEYTLSEYLFNESPAPVTITTGSAVRILYDIIYPGIPLNRINNNRDDFFGHERKH